ncbi:MAG: DUF177 domain-containing protein [Bacillota bacterium]|nr:DUF177 domain-containing protein [Bacillota bacterium]
MKISLNRVRDSKNGEIAFSYDIDFRDVKCSFDQPFQSPVHVSGKVFDHAEIMEAELLIDTEVKTSCARCAKEIQFPHSLKLNYLVSEDEHSDAAEENILCAENGELDIDEAVKSALLLSMDMVYLCRDDCKGLCPGCGADLNEGPCSCKKEIDPRLSVLRDLLEK